MYCVRSNARARGTVCDYGGPILAETDGPGGPLVAGDHLFRDTSIMHEAVTVHASLCESGWYSLHLI